MLTPSVQPPFSLQWGFSTRHTDASVLPPRRLHQVHGTAVHPCPTPDVASLEGDGLWTQTPGIRIGIRVADCVPILLAGLTAEGPWIAALHAGWRGVVAGMLEAGVSQFTALGGRCEALYYAFGPCIQACHFEVGPEVLQRAQGALGWDPSLARAGRGDRFMVDLHGLLKAQAIRLNLDPAKDGSIPRCTFCESEHFYSYRRGDLEGRQWGWAEIGR